MGKKGMRNSITFKYNILFGCIITFVAVFMASNQLLMHRYSSSYDKSVSLYLDVVGMKTDIHEADESIEEYLSTGNRAWLSEHNDAVHRIELALRRLRESTPAGEQASFLRAIEDSFYSYQTAWNYSAHYHNGGNTYQSYLYSEQARSIGSYLGQYCDELLQTAIAGEQEVFVALSLLQKRSLVLNIAAVATLCLVFVASVVYFRRNLTRPLDELYGAARRIAEGEQEVRVPEDYSEKTLSALSHAFNKMSRSITHMLQSLREKAEVETHLLNEQLKNAEYETQLEKASFLALQSQTNPHFLFNTLNSISPTITLGKEQEAVMMVDSLAALMRYSLSDIETPVTLGEELQVVGEYLRIQQYRFKERVTAQIDCPDHLCQSVRLPRLALQPLVENAVMHGLEPKPEGGHIRVWAEAQNGSCVIFVQDNGVGMDAVTRERVLAGAPRAPAAENPRHNSIGVYNTLRRLEMFTESTACFAITSEKGKGTTVRLCLPLAKEEEKDV